MPHRWKAPSHVLALLLASLLPGPLPAGGSRPEILWLLHANDIHGALEATPDRAGGPARFAARALALRRKALAEGAPLLVLHGGDLFQGSLAANESAGAAMPPLLDALRFGLAVPGNHEWDYGPAPFLALLARPRPLWLATNVAGLPPAARAAAVLTVGTRKVGFLGYALPETPRKAPPGATAGLAFGAGPESLAAEVRGLRARGVACLVLLAHLGEREAAPLAAALDLDLVVGGHTHLAVPPVRLPGSRAWYAQAGTELSHLGWLRLTLDPATGRLATLEGAVEALGSELPEDPGVAAAAAGWLAPYRARLDARVADLAAPLARGPWSGASDLHAALAEAIRRAGRAELGVINAAAARALALGPGPVDGATMYRAFPYENRVGVRSITGAALDRVFEDLVGGPWLPYPEPYRSQAGLPAGARINGDPRGILYPAGFDVRVDPARPAGDRVELADLAGAPLEPGRTYSLASSDYLLEGGDHYVGLGGSPWSRATSGVRSALEAYLAQDRADPRPGVLVNVTHADPGP